MAEWLLDGQCAVEYSDPANRRFHAQPVACPACGPHFIFQAGEEFVRGDALAIRKAADYLRSGRILAVIGLGGYHLACDAKNSEAVSALRARKYRKEKPFALMVKNIDCACTLVDLSGGAEQLLNSVARPIVLAPAKVGLPGVASENGELGVMLPCTPLHFLLFAAGAPEILVMISANRSSEPIAYRDNDALRQPSAIADGFLIGERPIARRVDDSVARAGDALGADLKNTITLVVHGQAFVSQNIGDLDHYESFCAFRDTIRDLLSMYEIDSNELLIVHDAHPQYISSLHAAELSASDKCATQHQRAHIASVLAERGAWDTRVVGASFDGTGYGDDGAI